MQTDNPYIQLKLDVAQRAELLEFVRHAPSTELGAWMKQLLPENGGTGHVPSHMDEVAAVLLTVLAATANAQHDRIAALERKAEELEKERVRA